MKKVIVIVGPTASGKTSLSIELAKRTNGEIVSADSMQIYQEMNIGTAKPTQEEMQGIPHHLLDFVSPEERFSVSDYKILAETKISEIIQKDHQPIVVGGTGLYINSLIYGIDYPNMKYDEAYRQSLEKIAKEKGNLYLYEKAKKIDEQAMQRISVNDTKRIIRVLEIYHATGKTKTQIECESRKNKPPFSYVIYGLYFDRAELYDRINQRVDQMMEQGLVEEVKQIQEKYQKFPTAMQAIGYKEVVDYLEGNCTKEEMVEKIKMETRRYAKRQMTWFRKIQEIQWIDGNQSMEEKLSIILGEK